MDLDTDKIDDAVLALLVLGLHGEGRAWKGFDWDALDRLHSKGYISDPKARPSRWRSRGRDWPGPSGFWSNFLVGPPGPAFSRRSVMKFALPATVHQQPLMHELLGKQGLSRSGMFRLAPPQESSKVGISNGFRTTEVGSGLVC